MTETYKSHLLNQLLRVKVFGQPVMTVGGWYCYTCWLRARRRGQHVLTSPLENDLIVIAYHERTYHACKRCAHARLKQLRLAQAYGMGARRFQETLMA